VSKSPQIDSLLDIMRQLRDPHGGCPWDREQDFESIAPFTIEEAYEVADAIDRRDYENLRSELGDLLFQVVFHARIAEERQLFAFGDVAQAISEKLVRRHPHVFGGENIASAADQNAAWEQHKARETTARGLGALDDVPLALPALKRAEKLGKRAASVGLDWADSQGARASIENELHELDGALLDGSDPNSAFEEMGDILFSVVNFARHLGVDPEEALRASNRKFTERFRCIEQSLAAEGRMMSKIPAGELDELWRQAKERLR
jgi:ATP diphosphatase